MAGLLFTAMFGYGLSRKVIRWRRGLNFYVFFTLLFNGGMVPTYLMYVNTFHIKNTLWALLIPSNILINGFNVLLMRTYFDGNVPDELIESGKIDGAGAVSYTHLDVYKRQLNDCLQQGRQPFFLLDAVQRSGLCGRRHQHHILW